MREYLHFLQEQFPGLLKFTAFYMGACVGSFLNVCILRIPLGRSVVTPRSHCACGKLIVWYDNIPILSWFFLRGRARCCGQKFSFRYPLIEATTAGTFLWLWMTLPPSTAVAGMVFFALLLLGAMIDLDHMILPDLSTLGGLVLGVIFSGLWPQLHGLPGGDWQWAVAKQGIYLALGGAVIGAGIVYWIGEMGCFVLRRPAMGYGDMLLMGCVGAFAGWRGTVVAIFGGACLGVIGVVLNKIAVSRQPAPAVTETPTEEIAEPAADETTPLGRRLFQVDYMPIMAAMLGAAAWLWHIRGTTLIWPGAVFLGVILIFALAQRGKLALHETWLLLGVVVGIILSSVLPHMQGLTPSGNLLLDAMPAMAGSTFSAVVGAGAALWLMEIANLIRLNFFPTPAVEPEVAYYNQIWGEGYLVLFGGVGAFCGWRTALVSVAAFAVVGALKSIGSFFATQKPAKAAANAETPAATESAPQTWAIGQEIPFGPWLALGGFLYYALPVFHSLLGPYFDIFRALALGQMPQ
jgi:leader peptidase (prepilin peptidase)/N-methyltransferase